MGDFSRLQQADINEILCLYDLGEVLSFAPLSLGISNSNYRVNISKAGKKESVLLKVSNDKGQHHLKGELDTLRYLRDQEFPYSIYPIPTNEDQSIYTWNNHFGVVYPFIPGITPGPSDFTCEEIGKGLALLHKVPIENNCQIRSYDEVGFNAQKILDFLQDSRCPDDFKEFFDAVFPDQLEGYRKTSFPNGVIHGDLYYDNTLFDKNHLAVLLDFEQSGLGPLIFDIGISISGTCLEKGCIHLPLVRSFLKGYQSVRPLSEDELKYFDTAVLLGLFSISLWRVKRFTIGNLDQSRFYSYRELLVRAINFHKGEKTSWTL